MDSPEILSDEYYRRCLELAKESKGSERYGSLLVFDGDIIGKGFNRAIAHPSWDEGLEREIKQGYANHAEIEAMNDALSEGIDIGSSELYVAGYFPDSGNLFFQKEYTCTICLPYMQEYDIETIYIPMPGEWIGKTLDEAEEEAKEFEDGTHENRLEAAMEEFSIEEVDL